MPSLFDSHDEFNEWFSKDIENAAENKGNKLNEHQLRRLHMILKPFMLRRIKKHVQNELSEKVATSHHNALPEAHPISRSRSMSTLILVPDSGSCTKSLPPTSLLQTCLPRRQTSAMQIPLVLS